MVFGISSGDLGFSSPENRRFYSFHVGSFSRTILALIMRDALNDLDYI